MGKRNKYQISIVKQMKIIEEEMSIIFRKLKQANKIFFLEQSGLVDNIKEHIKSTKILDNAYTETIRLHRKAMIKRSKIGKKNGTRCDY